MSSQQERRTLRRAIAASAIGNATEWFDYGVYAYTAVYIGKAFFPSADPTASTLGSLLVFAASFLIRPLGGLVWGPLGDRAGRQKVLALTILLMAASTFCVGLLPGYGTLGILAPIGLVLLRMVQGFSTGGEYGGAATFMAEYAPDRKRGLCGSFLEFGTLAGLTSGALLVLVAETVLGTEAMQSWGWRLPFLVAAPLGLVGLYLRSKLKDTPVFRELSKSGQVEEQTGTQFRDLFSYWRPLVLLMALVVTLNVANYTLLAYMPTYVESELGLSSGDSLKLVIIGQLVMMVLLPFSGSLSDRVGRKPLWWVSIIGLFVLAIPLYKLMAQGYPQAIIAFALLGLLYIPQLSTISAMFPAMFPAHVRYAGFAIAYNVSTSLFGGTAPAVNQGLIGATGDSLVPAYYMMGACVVGAVALWFVPETNGASLRGREIPSVDNEELAPAKV
ncbi:MFS transporter [Kutzneria viridogrisea]|uniref:MHS family proline/betaine transporter-like MFS transporter n=2 Tax=Kutzneria TaxID=43356 RepID=A0ABR6BN33_9PSEU|nr:MFS transporter [Kutzneria albida]AHH96466.1 Proline/betaine transporter [Kutzneria albida DSM 43870]MBA8928316.1 MHS family proline/betaine transporter-like MFS transporter [Kutzneria viridogrisea]